MAAAKLFPLPLTDAVPPISAGELWRDRSAVLYLVRRPGCVLCRAEATKLYTLKPELDALGVSLVAVLHENREEQVEQFRGEFWPGAPVYLDTDMALFKAVGGGQVRVGSLSWFLNPFSRIWKNVAAANAVVKSSNLEGEGTKLGGLYVVKKGGDVQFAFQEKTFGDHAPPEEVIAAAKAAAAA